MVDSDSRPLLGLRTCLEIGLIQRLHEMSDISGFIQQNKKVFYGEGRFPDKCMLEIKPNCVPTSTPLRRIPIGI